MSGEEAARSEDRDDAAIARFLAGDTSAFNELYDRYADYVFNIAYGVLGNTDAAADVTQEVFLLVYRALNRFRRGSRFATWLYRIALNRALDAARAAKRRKWLPWETVMDRRSAPETDPATQDDQRDLTSVINRVLENMPEEPRKVLTLRYFSDLTVEEIAEVLGCSVPAAKVRLHRARRKFKDVLEKLYPEGWDA